MKLLCDEMLALLGRWLRAAGYDTLIAPPGSDDCRLIEIAMDERRVLLTRDRGLAARAGAAVRVALLERDGGEAQAHELAHRLVIDWLREPFARCVVDNAPLREATDREAEAAPAQARAVGGSFLACPHCGRLYWAITAACARGSKRGGLHASRLEQAFKESCPTRSVGCIGEHTSVVWRFWVWSRPIARVYGAPEIDYTVR